MDLGLVAGLELRADLIFMITDGTPSIRAGRKTGEETRWRQRVDSYEQERARYDESQKGQREMARAAAAKLMPVSAPTIAQESFGRQGVMEIVFKIVMLLALDMEH